ncbi:hypothetical protein H7X65_00135 [Candidatus Parcubacteria bacterium]|nr:hypothetical protein [Candidatus Parcubacteria bacterium]
MSQELSQRIDIGPALQIEIDNGPKRLEVSLDEILEFPGDFAWRRISDDESDYSPESVGELEEEKKKLDERYYIILDEGYVAMVSINPVTFSIAWPRTREEKNDGTFDHGGTPTPPRVKVSLWDYVR